MNIGIIGAGRLGCAIAVALKNSGYEISGIASRSDSSAEWLAACVGKKFTNDIVQTVMDSQVIFLTVPDGLVAGIAGQIAALCGKTALKGKTFFHCSGALSSDILDVLGSSGAATGSLHPVQTFADRENGWKGLYDIYFGFEGTAAAAMIAGRIADDLGGRMLVISKQNKAVYHAVACMLSNYIVSLSRAASVILGSVGIDGDDGVKAFIPLMEKTIRNIKEMGPVKALTGPISRGDAGVVATHVGELEKINPEYAELYRSLGRIALDMASKREDTEEQLFEEMRRILCHKGDNGDKGDNGEKGGDQI